MILTKLEKQALDRLMEYWNPKELEFEICFAETSTTDIKNILCDIADVSFSSRIGDYCPAYIQIRIYEEGGFYSACSEQLQDFIEANYTEEQRNMSPPFESQVLKELSQKEYSDVQGDKQIRMLSIKLDASSEKMIEKIKELTKRSMLSIVLLDDGRTTFKVKQPFQKN